MVLLVDLEVIREIFDALTQERDLDFGRTRVGVVETMLGNDGGLRAGGLRHKSGSLGLLRGASIRRGADRSTSGNAGTNRASASYHTARAAIPYPKRSGSTKPRTARSPSPATSRIRL